MSRSGTMRGSWTVGLLALCSGWALAAPQAKPLPEFQPWGFDLKGQNRAVKPGDDFYEFANGAWHARTVIPADQTEVSTFLQARDEAKAQTLTLVREAAAGKLSGDKDAALIAALYRSFMNESRVEQLDAAPLQPRLKAISEASRDGLSAMMGGTNKTFGRALFPLNITEDSKKPGQRAISVRQAATGLPREYYLEAGFKDKKDKYRDYVAAMLGYAGWPDAGAEAGRIVEFETRLAEASWSLAERRDDEKLYNPMSVTELERLVPGFPWQAYLNQAGLGTPARLIVNEMSALPKIGRIYAETPLQTLRAWYAFSTIDTAAPYLSKRFLTASFNFRDRALRGQLEQKPREQRAMDELITILGEPLGRLYAARHFTPQTKAKVQALVEDLRAATAARVQSLKWMSPSVKAEALQKVKKLRVKIGYPEKWRDYSGYRVDEGDLFGNGERANAFRWGESVANLNKPIDPDLWPTGWSPAQARAGFFRTRNEMVYTAGILQPPFFDANADAAVNYGGIGGVIGHEIIHGFDDQGRRMDANGMMRDWWTPEDARTFKGYTDQIVTQFSNYEPLPGAKINGGLTTGENVADLGGLTIALDAYRASLRGKRPPVLSGLTGEQRFFLGWAQVWRAKYSNDKLRQMLISDVHSPAEYRAMGPLPNIDSWYRAFNVKPGDKLYLPPAARNRMWQ